MRHGWSEIIPKTGGGETPSTNAARRGRNNHLPLSAIPTARVRRPGVNR